MYGVATYVASCEGALRVQRRVDNAFTIFVTAPVEELERRLGERATESSGVIEERVALVSEACPAPYADTFARLNHQKPITVSDAQWSRALDDAGRFLDDWGAEAAAMQWGAGELFDVPREGRPGGLVWQLRGERVEAHGADHARTENGRTIER